MGKLVALKSEYTTVAMMIEEVISNHKECTDGIIIVWNNNGDGMHIHYHANDQQMSMASTRLAYLANLDES